MTDTEPLVARHPIYEAISTVQSYADSAADGGKSGASRDEYHKALARLNAAADTIERLTRLRDQAQADAAKFLTRTEAAEAEVERLKRALGHSEEAGADAAMRAHRWMVAHDMLNAGKPYSLPSPADLPDAIARAEAAEAEVARLRSPIEGMRTSEDRLAKLAKLSEEASPGPWGISGVSLNNGNISVRSEKQRIIIADVTNAASLGDFVDAAMRGRMDFGAPDTAKTQYANADLIAAAREAIPDLLHDLAAANGAAEIAEAWADPTYAACTIGEITDDQLELVNAVASIIAAAIRARGVER